MSSRLVIVGGGAVGLSTALYAQARDMEVTVVERAHLGAGASGHNGGIFSLGNCLPTSTPDLVLGLPRMLMDPLSPLSIRWSYLPRMAPWLVRFVASGRPRRVEQISIAMAQLLARSLEAYEPLLPPGSIIPSPGHLIGFATDRAFKSSELGLEIRRRRGIPLQILDPVDIGNLDPALEGVFSRGILITDAPYVEEPSATVAALGARLVAKGGSIVADEVVDFECRSGDVSAVVTRQGVLYADAFVVAAGVWSKPLAAALGSRLPLDTERGYGVHLPDPKVVLRVPVISADHHIALTPAGNSALRIVGTDELAGVEAPPDYRRADLMVEVTRLMFPELNSSGANRWMSYRPSMPDSLPVIGRSPAMRNAYFAFGHGHTGFTTAAITGKLVTQLITGAATDIDLEPFSPTRFG